MICFRSHYTTVAIPTYIEHQNLGQFILCSIATYYGIDALYLLLKFKLLKCDNLDGGVVYWNV